MKSYYEVKQIYGHSLPTYNVHYFHNSESCFVTASDDRLIKLWDAEKMLLQHTFHGAENCIAEISISYDNSIMAASCVRSKKIFLFNLLSGNLFHTRDMCAGEVSTLMFRPNTLQVAASFTGGEVVLIDTTSFNIVEQFKSRAPVAVMAFDNSGRFMITGDEAGHIVVSDLKLETRTVLASVHQSRITHLSFCVNAPIFCSGSFDGRVLVIDVEHCNIMYEISLDAVPIAIIWTADGSRIITSSQKSVADTETAILSVWRVGDVNYPDDGKILPKPDLLLENGHSIDCKSVFTLAAHPTEGRVIMTGGDDSRVCIWNVHTGECLRFFDVKHVISHGTFSPTGHKIVVSTKNGPLIVFEHVPRHVAIDLNYEYYHKHQEYETEEERLEQQANCLERCDRVGKHICHKYPLVPTQQFFSGDYKALPDIVFTNLFGNLHLNMNKSEYLCNISLEPYAVKNFVANHQHFPVRLKKDQLLTKPSGTSQNRARRVICDQTCTCNEVNGIVSDGGKGSFKTINHCSRCVTNKRKLITSVQTPQELEEQIYILDYGFPTDFTDIVTFRCKPFKANQNYESTIPSTLITNDLILIRIRLRPVQSSSDNEIAQKYNALLQSDENLVLLLLVGDKREPEKTKMEYQQKKKRMADGSLDVRFTVKIMTSSNSLKKKAYYLQILDQSKSVCLVESNSFHVWTRSPSAQYPVQQATPKLLFGNTIAPGNVIGVTFEGEAHPHTKGSAFHENVLADTLYVISLYLPKEIASSANVVRTKKTAYENMISQQRHLNLILMLFDHAGNKAYRMNDDGDDSMLCVERTEVTDSDSIIITISWKINFSVRCSGAEHQRFTLCCIDELTELCIFESNPFGIMNKGKEKIHSDHTAGAIRTLFSGTPPLLDHATMLSTTIPLVVASCSTSTDPKKKKTKKATSENTNLVCSSTAEPATPVRLVRIKLAKPTLSPPSPKPTAIRKQTSKRTTRPTKQYKKQSPKKQKTRHPTSEEATTTSVQPEVEEDIVIQVLFSGPDGNDSHFFPSRLRPHHSYHVCIEMKPASSQTLSKYNQDIGSKYKSMMEDDNGHFSLFLVSYSDKKHMKHNKKGEQLMTVESEEFKSVQSLFSALQTSSTSRILCFKIQFAKAKAGEMFSVVGVDKRAKLCVFESNFFKIQDSKASPGDEVAFVRCIFSDAEPNQQAIIKNLEDELVIESLEQMATPAAEASASDASPDNIEASAGASASSSAEEAETEETNQSTIKTCADAETTTTESPRLEVPRTEQSIQQATIDVQESSPEANTSAQDPVCAKEEKIKENVQVDATVVAKNIESPANEAPIETNSSAPASSTSGAMIIDEIQTTPSQTNIATPTAETNSFTSSDNEQTQTKIEVQLESTTETASTPEAGQVSQKTLRTRVKRHSSIRPRQTQTEEKPQSKPADDKKRKRRRISLSQSKT